MTRSEDSLMLPLSRLFARSRLGFAEFFGHVACSHPNRTAIVAGKRSMTYCELQSRADQIAWQVVGAAGSRAERIGICLPRSFNLIAAILACQKLGSFYVPLDPEYPKSRLNFMLTDAAPGVLVTTSDLARELGFENQQVPLVLLDAEPNGAVSPEASTGLPVSGEGRAGGYVIYTSGSTGTPKGVEMTGQPLLNLVRWQAALTDLPDHAATGQFAPISFDVSFQEIFSTLCTGGTLVLFSREQRVDPYLLLEEIRRTGIARLFLPFVALQQLARSAVATREYPTCLREIHTAGEQLVVSDPLRELFCALPSCRLYNQYGPSETHVVSCHELDPDPAKWLRLPPIGRPIPNVGLHVLGDDGRPAPPGRVGELCVSGIALAEGYFRNPVRTAERFPVIELNGSATRVYRTGDLVETDASGIFHFRGRVDQQVKIDGHRVELGEIESIIADHPAVDETVVLFDREATPSGRLIACVTLSDSGEKADPTSLLKHLRDRLPAYMVPETVRVLTTLLKTSSGKVDRKALLDEMRQPATLRFEPSGDLCRDILIHWRGILNNPSLGPLDNLFEHGARSVMVPEFQRRMLETHGTKIAATAIFQHPSPKGLSDFLAGSRGPDRNTRGLHRAAEALRAVQRLNRRASQHS
jgi:amino acid adenylation domain-containing protein